MVSTSLNRNDSSPIGYKRCDPYRQVQSNSKPGKRRLPSPFSPPFFLLSYYQAHHCGEFNHLTCIRQLQCFILSFTSYTFFLSNIIDHVLTVIYEDTHDMGYKLALINRYLILTPSQPLPSLVWCCCCCCCRKRTPLGLTNSPSCVEDVSAELTESLSSATSDV